VRWAALGVVLVLVSAFVLYSAGGVEWQVERIEGTSGTVYWPFVAVNDTGSLHMTYYVVGSLVYAMQTEHGWERSVVTTDMIRGVSPLVFGPTGDPHICYHVWSEGSSYESPTLVHAEKTGDDWTRSTISNNSYQGSQSIALDANGKAHVAFVRAGDVVYANNSNGHWVETTLIDEPEYDGPSPPSNRGMTSIAVDQSGHPHVAVGYDSHFVGVFSEAGGSWNLSTLYNWGLTYDSVSMAIDGNGKILVVYWGYPLGEPIQGGVMLATRDSGIWEVSPILIRTDVIHSVFRCALSVDRIGQIRIAIEGSGSAGSFLGALEQSRGVWEFSKVVDYGEYQPYLDLQLSICSNDEAHTIVPVSRGLAEYATDSPDLPYRLYTVLPLALASYIVGLLIWSVVLAVLRVVSRRTEGTTKEH